MSREERRQSTFLPGEAVLNKEWGVGQVLEVEEGPQGGIVVDFPSKPRHRMSFEIAGRALSKLPVNGLEAVLLREPGKVTQWSQTAPLKLIAIALTDLSKAAKAADIRKKLDRPNILRVKWESWWKRVQPAIKQSPHFRLHLDGTYQLASTLDHIPESRLPALPKRTRAARLSAAQLENVTSRLSAGEIGFESLKDAKNLRLVARKIFRGDATPQMIRTAIGKALTGPVQHARIILEELSASGRLQEFIEALVQFTNHIGNLAVTPAKKPGKGVGESVVAKARLLEDVVREFARRRQPDGELQFSPFVHTVLWSGLAIWRKEVSGWRSDSLDHLSKAVTILAEREPEIFGVAGEYLSKHEGPLTSRLDLTDRLLSRVSPEAYSKVVNNLLISSLAGAPEFVEECFSRHLKKEQHLAWVSSTLLGLMSSYDIRATEILARLLMKAGHPLGPTELRMWVELAIAMAAVSPGAKVALGRMLIEKLTESIANAAKESGRRALRVEEHMVLDAIKAAYEAQLEKEREQARALHTSLEAEMERLRAALEGANAESTRMKALIKQLQSGYRLPEWWASFQGKKETLESIAALYQEAFLVRDVSGVDASFKDWVLRRLEVALQKEGVLRFGQADSAEIYAPALHEFIPGSEGTSKEVKIMCPGFEWRDPAGNRIILAKAKVTG